MIPRRSKYFREWQAIAKINFTPGVLADMKEAKAHITHELYSEQSAINTIEKNMKRIRQLAAFPMIGAPLSSIIDLQVLHRFPLYGNYTAFYKVEDGRVYIIRVFYRRRTLCRCFSEKYITNKQKAADQRAAAIYVFGIMG